jgi:hypothetical protein
MTLPDVLEEALSRPVGARFRRCAMQVNPYAYLKRERMAGAFPDAHSYNTAVVDALVLHEIELIGITDHDRTDDDGLRAAAEAVGITVFPGVEVCSSDNVHALVLFDPATDKADIELFLGWCEVDRSAGQECRPCGRPLPAILEEAGKRGAVTVLPHAVGEKGLFAEMNGQPLVRVWTSPHLLAVAIPGTVGDLGQRESAIVRGRDASYERQFPVAVVNANDVRGPQDVHQRSWTWVKVATDTIEGLRQAFLDPESRVRLSSDPDPADHSELIALAWEGGFLDGCRLRLNENLNVLIGGRGAGKSTVIESIRYVLGVEPLGSDAEEVHRGIIDKVLGAGAQVTLLVRSTRPDHRRYVIERTVPDPPIVRSEEGERLPLTPRDVMPHTEIYGQHEIAELARRRERRAALLARFVDSDPAGDADRARVRRELARSREQVADLLRQRTDLDADLARLPVLEEQLRRFEEVGVEDRLQEQARFTREAAILDRVDETVTELTTQIEALGEAATFDLTFIEAKATEELPSRDLLQAAKEALVRLQEQLGREVGQAKSMLGSARTSLASVRTSWIQRRDAANQAYEAVLRTLGPESAQARTFVQLRRTIEQLRPLQGRRSRVEKALTAARAERQDLLDDSVAQHGRLAEAYRKAAKRVSRQLRHVVEVTFRHDASRENLIRVLRDVVGGRLDLIQRAIEEREALSPAALAQACREGPDAVLAYLPGASQAQAESVCGGLDEAAIMRIEEVTLGPGLDVELNVGSRGKPQWRELEDLSTGQKATALLLLLLLDSYEPLIVDQPEDDLDNEFISEGVVPRIRESKRTRQFLISSHNANLPVLGDAELIAVLRASGEPGAGRGSIATEETGSIDSPRVREAVEQLLEGGHAAFERRRRKYGF